MPRRHNIAAQQTGERGPSRHAHEPCFDDGRHVALSPVDSQRAPVEKHQHDRFASSHDVFEQGLLIRAEVAVGARSASAGKMLGQVLRIFIDTVASNYRKRLADRGIADGGCGAVTVVQRANSPFEIDTICPRCNPPLRLIAMIETEDTSKKILKAMGLPCSFGA
jgi:hypothetical protein